MTEASAGIAIAGSEDADAPVVLIHYGSPHTGRHLDPVVEAATRLGLRLVAIPRPGYGAERRIPDRDVATSARLALDAMDRLGIERFATIGYSGGGPHALAVAAMAPHRVRRAAVLASPAPYDGSPGWLEGIRDRRGLEAALRGRVAREEQEARGEFDPASFTPADWSLLEGSWAALGADAGAAAGALGAVDDDIAFVRPWGVDLRAITVPVVIAHGDEDRVVPVHHARAIAALLRRPELRIIPGAGHIGVLRSLPDALADLATG